MRLINKIRQSDAAQALLLASLVVLPILIYVASTGRTLFPVNILQDCCGWSYAQDEWIPKNTQISDTVDYILPMKVYTYTTLELGEFPLWNPFVFGGSEFFSNSQSAVMHPMNVLYVLFGPLTAHTISVVLSIYVMVLFSYLLLKRFGLRSLPSAIGAIGYVSIPWVMFWLEWGTIGWVMAIWPALLFFLYEFRTSGYKDPIKIGIVTVILGVQILFGHLQFALFSFVIVGVWWMVSFFIDKAVRKRIIVTGILSCVLALMIGSVGLINTIAMSKYGHRSETKSVGMDAIMKYDILPQTRMIEIAEDPDLYVPNAIQPEVTRALLLAGLVLGGISVYKKRIFRSARAHVYIVFVAILLVGFGFAASLPVFRDIFKVLPIGKGILLHYFIALTIMAMPFLAGLSFDRILSLVEERRRRVSRGSSRLALAAVSIVATISLLLSVKAGIEFYATKQPQVIGVYALAVLAVLLIAAWVLPRCYRFVMQILSLILVFIMVLQYWAYMYAAIPMPKKAVYNVGNPLYSCIKQDANERGVAFPRAMSVLSSNSHMTYGIGVLNGYDSLYPITDKEFQDARNYPHTQREVYGDNALLDVNFEKKNLNANLGVNYLVLYKDAQKPSGYSPICHDPTERYQVYKADEKTEVIYLAQSITSASEADQLRIIRDDALAVGSVMLDTDSVPAPSRGSVTSYKIEANTIDATVSISGDKGLLFIGQSYHPGWSATVDGKDATIQKANYKFMALSIGPGEHVIKMTFAPPYFAQSIIISGFGLVGLFCGLLYLRYTKRK